MFNRAPSLGRLTLALLCLVGLIGLFFAVRCQPVVSSSSATVAPVGTPWARLTVLNSSECEWQIVIIPATGGDGYTWTLPVAKSLEVELAGGDYAVTQTMLTAAIGPRGATRRFPMRLAAGQSYRWRLMTLLSGAAVGAIPTAGDKGRP